jgi:hypothetical protein
VKLAFHGFPKMNLCSDQAVAKAALRAPHPIMFFAPRFCYRIRAQQVMIEFTNGLGSSLEHVRAGKLRGLAVTTMRRSEALPEVPAVAEFVPGYEASNWWGIAAPRNTPMDIVAKLNSEITRRLPIPR